MLNKVFQLVTFTTLSSFSVGNVNCKMANSELTRAIQASKNCARDRKSRHVLSFRSCFLRGLKYRVFRTSRPEVFLRKGVLKICSKFTGEHPCRSAISIKLLCRKCSYKNALLKKFAKFIGNY